MRIVAASLVTALAGIALPGCLGAQKIVGAGETCGHAAFSGDVVCDTGLTCVITASQHEWVGNESGTCWRVCSHDGDCGAAGLCLSGYCGLACDPAAPVCPGTVICCAGASGVSAACLPSDVCTLAGDTPSTGGGGAAGGAGAGGVSGAGGRGGATGGGR